MDESVLFVLIMIFIYIFLFGNRNNTIYIESKTGTKFLVHKDNLQKEKAILLGDIVKDLYILKNYLVTNIDKYPEYTKYIKQLDDNFTEDRTNVYETDPDSTLTSYSVNKGEELAMCLKSKKTGKLHDKNLLMYVAIHEMSHFACPEIGHGKLFRKIFKKFTQVAIELNIYKKVNFDSNPVEYCGMILSSSII